MNSQAPRPAGAAAGGGGGAAAPPLREKASRGGERACRRMERGQVATLAAGAAPFIPPHGHGRTRLDLEARVAQRERVCGPLAEACPPQQERELIGREDRGGAGRGRGRQPARVARVEGREASARPRHSRSQVCEARGGAWEEALEAEVGEGERRGGGGARGALEEGGEGAGLGCEDAGVGVARASARGVAGGRVARAPFREAPRDGVAGERGLSERGVLPQGLLGRRKRQRADLDDDTDKLERSSGKERGDVSKRALGVDERARGTETEGRRDRRRRRSSLGSAEERRRAQR